jgi:hypothetical protein
MSTASVAGDGIGERQESPGSKRKRRRCRFDPRRARAGILWGLAVFAVILGSTSAVVELRLPRLVDPVYLDRVRYVRQANAAKPGCTRTLVLFGTSRTYEGVDAPALSRSLSDGLGQPVTAVNWGIPGCTFGYNLLTWQRMQRDGVRPDLLVIEVMPSLFHADDEAQIGEELAPASRLGYSDLPLVNAGPRNRPGLRREVALAEACTLYSRRYALAWALSPRMVPALDDERRPFVWPLNLSSTAEPRHPSSEQRAKALELAYEQYHDHLTNFRTPRAEILRNLLASCQQSGISTALLVMPEGPTYRSWYGPETWPRIQAWLNRTSSEFASPVINTREWMAEEDFSDSHHLLPQAAAPFSERLGREGVLPVLRRLPSFQESRQAGERIVSFPSSPEKPRTNTTLRRPD